MTGKLMTTGGGGTGCGCAAGRGRSINIGEECVVATIGARRLVRRHTRLASAARTGTARKRLNHRPAERTQVEGGGMRIARAPDQLGVGLERLAFSGSGD